MIVTLLIVIVLILLFGPEWVLRTVLKLAGLGVALVVLIAVLSMLASVASG